MDVLALLGVIGIIIFLPTMAIQSGIDERLTKEGYARAKEHNDLVYYDQKSRCYRSVKTGQKATEHIGNDINGEPFKYVLTLPLFSTMVEGEFIEARYINVNKWKDPVLFTKKDKMRFFGG